MKLLFIIIWGSIAMTSSSITQATAINIKVTGIDVKRGGNIIVMLFSEKGFPKIHQQALATQTKHATKETLTFNFRLNKPELAVKILHDENGDGKVTKNWTGIYPKEGLGFSNGQKIGMTGPPTYKNSKLAIHQFKEGLNILVRYP